MNNGLQMKYFVLKPKGKDVFAEASREAMRAYAAIIGPHNPELANELEAWVRNEQVEAQEAK